MLCSERVELSRESKKTQSHSERERVMLCRPQPEDSSPRSERRDNYCLHSPFSH